MKFKGYDVPEGATHVAEYGVQGVMEFYKNVNGEWCYYHPIRCKWILSVINKLNSHAIELPETEQEEWLPPVGHRCKCVVEYFGTYRAVCKVISYNGDKVWVDVEGRSDSVFRLSMISFHPLKTQEETEREAFIEKAQKATNADDNDITATDIFNDMYDAGARFTAPEVMNDE